ncbi:MAG: RNA repair domain-containing protein [Candidatus Aenigmatarchaeota archaeon]
MAFQTLNRLKWEGKLSLCRVKILHRGAPGDEKAVEGRDIREVKKSYFTYESVGKETFIPLHRVRKIECAGETVWKKKTVKG